MPKTKRRQQSRSNLSNHRGSAPRRGTAQPLHAPAPAKSPRRVLDLHIGQAPPAPFLTLGHKVQPPGLPQLGPPKFTAADQEANPDAPMTRVVKDVLRAGSWKVGELPNGEVQMWDVSLQTISEMAASYELAQSRGISMNLCWGHGDPFTKIVDMRDGIAPIDQLFAQDGVLWMSAYVTPQQARDLSNPQNKVSIRAVEGWLDGRGNQYPVMLLHVAVVDNPVMDSQGPFTVDMANDHILRLFPRKRTIDMAMDLATTVEQFNAVLAVAYPGVSLPEDVTDENFNEIVGVVLSTLTGSAPEPEPQEDNTGMATDGATVSDDMAVSGVPNNGAFLSHTNAKTGKVRDMALAKLEAKVIQLENERRIERKQAFEGRIKDMQSVGAIDAKTGILLRSKGEAWGFDLSLLEPFSNGKMVDMSNASKRFANGDEPKLPGARPSDDEIKAHVAKRGIDPKHVPTLHPAH